VTRPNLPDTFSRQQAAVQQQIDAVTRFSQLGNSTIKDGAVIVLDDAGAARLSIGEYTFAAGPYAGMTIYGTVAFDTSGNVRTVFGQLPNGDYGLMVIDSSGNGREVLPVYEITGAGPYNVATMTATSLVSGTAPIGKSGNAYVTLTGTLVALSSSGLNATLTLYVDGTATTLALPVGNNGPNGVAGMSVSGRTLITGLSNATHNFAAYITLATTPETVQITNVAIQVEPV
jgi:hypothetical protein